MDQNDIDAMLREALSGVELSPEERANMEFADALPEMRERAMREANQFMEENGQSAMQTQIYIVRASICPKAGSRGPAEFLDFRAAGTLENQVGKCGELATIVAFSQYEVMSLVMKLNDIVGGNLDQVQGADVLMEFRNEASWVTVEAVIPASAILMTPMMPFKKFQ